MSFSSSIGYLKLPWSVAYPSVEFTDVMNATDSPRYISGVSVIFMGSAKFLSAFGASSSLCSSTEINCDDLIVLGGLYLFFSLLYP